MFVFVDSRFVGFDIGTDVIDNLGGFLQCFAVFIDGFGQVGKVLVVFSHDFFQTQTAEVIGFNIVFCCCFFGNLAIFINVVEGVSGFESVDVLGIVVGLNQGGVGNFAVCFKVFIQTADGSVKSIVSFVLFFQFFSIFIDSFFDVGNFCSDSFYFCIDLGCQLGFQFGFCGGDFAFKIFGYLGFCFFNLGVYF